MQTGGQTDYTDTQTDTQRRKAASELLSSFSLLRRGWVPTEHFMTLELAILSADAYFWTAQHSWIDGSITVKCSVGLFSRSLRWPENNWKPAGFVALYYTCRWNREKLKKKRRVKKCLTEKEINFIWTINASYVKLDKPCKSFMDNSGSDYLNIKLHLFLFSLFLYSFSLFLCLFFYFFSFFFLFFFLFLFSKWSRK